MDRILFGLMTDSDGVASEACLCPECFKDSKNIAYAKEMGSQSGDVCLERFFKFVGLDEDRFKCCICEDVDCSMDIYPDVDTEGEWIVESDLIDQ